MEIVVRTLVHHVAETRRESGRDLERPHRVALVAAVIENPYPTDGYVADLLDGLDDAAEELGRLIGPPTVELLGDDVEAYGKAAIVGIAGEVEHGSALIHNLRFGNAFRGPAGGSELLPAAEKVGPTGASVDIPLKHTLDATTRSHHQTFTFQIADAPRHREIVVACVAANQGRPLARLATFGAEVLPSLRSPATQAAAGRSLAGDRSLASVVDAMTTTATDPLLGIRPDDPEWIAAAHREFTITSWSTQSNVHPLPIAGGEGSWFWDHTGKRYLDFESQLVNLNLGHQHPRLVEAIKRQADRLCYIGPSMGSDVRSELGALLAEITPGDLKASFFTTGGAAAIENAVRLARHVTGRSKIVTRYRSYHGATAGAISLTGDPRRWGAEPAMPGVVRMFDPYTYRCPAGHPDPCPVCSGAPHLEEILMYEGADTVAAVVLETVTGTNGIIPPPDGYLASVREVCDRHGILLILDEVMAGFGRTGRMFACDNWDVVPDILCVAKGLNSGYVPLGAMIVSAPIKDWLETHPFPGGQTYAGHPLACATGVETIHIYRDERIVERAAERAPSSGRC